MSSTPGPALRAKVSLAVRLQEPLSVLIYLAGFLAPWQPGGAHATLWLALATWAARTGWLTVENATTAVTIAALACLVTGTLLRMRGYLRPAAMRKRLSLGGWLLAVGTSILMPPGGAAGFLLLFSVFSLYLAFAEGRTIAAGDPPLWWRAVLAETFPVAFTVCFATLAWRYNTAILVRCLLICYGASLLVQALPIPRAWGEGPAGP